MRTAIRHTTLLALPAMLAACGALSQSAAAEGVSPLPASNYTVRPVCAAPTAGHAGCLALELISKTAAARAHSHPLGITTAATLAPDAKPTSGAFGLRPGDLHRAYRLPDDASTTQTIALVDAYDDPHAEADLAVYDETFRLPACTTANGCFKKVNQNGETTHLPAANEGWAVEISLDVQAAHAICESCHIMLVEASTASYEALDTAELTAGRLGATEISNSWGGPEEGNWNLTAFEQKGRVITAAAGDDGYLSWDSGEGRQVGYANFPAASPHVVAVGGTRLQLSKTGTWEGETVWNGLGAGGGGCSTVFTAPAWQESLSDWSSVGCGTHRSAADVAADADPYTGLAIYDSSSECESEPSVHWCPIGGTSLASPLIAGVYALAGGAHGVEYPAKTLYEGELKAPLALHDITTGSNGECKASYTSDGLSGCTPAQEAATSCASELRCLAGVGYDGPTGVGTPDGTAAFEPGGGNHGGEEPAAEPEEEEEPAPPETAHNADGEPASDSSTADTASPILNTPVISGLTLTHAAATAQVHQLDRVSKVAFSFRINVSTWVRAALSVRVRSHGRTIWRELPVALEIDARRGSDRARMHAHSKLPPGLYRLTLAPGPGVPRSIVFRVI